ncbi:MAG: hypothetical protein IPL62_13730 [Caulobacteraceae bacterium]|nr:hypothetical protein [Caulobacteraceae bacterium]
MQLSVLALPEDAVRLQMKIAGAVGERDGFLFIAIFNIKADRRAGIVEHAGVHREAHVTHVVAEFFARRQSCG